MTLQVLDEQPELFDSHATPAANATAIAATTATTATAGARFARRTVVLDTTGGRALGLEFCEAEYEDAPYQMEVAAVESLAAGIPAASKAEVYLEVHLWQAACCRVAGVACYISVGRYIPF